jgi:hypothetical protein
MPITVDELRSAASQTRVVKFADGISDARRRGVRTAFLCHSHKDVQIAEGLTVVLAQQGWRLYVDWKDTQMPEHPNRETAERIQARIIECNCFLFLATANSTQSRWCPWEIGFADGKKTLDDIFVVPTRDSIGTYGSEYLELYRRIDYTEMRKLGAWRPKQTQGVLVESL